MKEKRPFSHVTQDAKYLSEVRRSIARKGILQEIELVSVKELPRTQRLGSTDRKGYTVAIVLGFLGEFRTTYVDIQPWTLNQEQVIAFHQDKAKSDFANWIYDELFGEINITYQYN